MVCHEPLIHLSWKRGEFVEVISSRKDLPLPQRNRDWNPLRIKTDNLSWTRPIKHERRVQMTDVKKHDVTRNPPARCTWRTYPREGETEDSSGLVLPCDCPLTYFPPSSLSDPTSEGDEWRIPTVTDWRRESTSTVETLRRERYLRRDSVIDERGNGKVQIPTIVLGW